jgi:hypothetical protein
MKRQGKRIKRKIASIVFFFLGRGLKAAYKLDESIRKEFESFQDGEIIRMKIEPVGPSLAFMVDKGKLYTMSGAKAATCKPHIDILFKNIDGALQVLLAQAGIAEAYCQHRILVVGDIYKTVGIIRVMDKVENYLFPGFIAKKLLVRRPPKAVSSARIYLKVLTNI